jgi:hypothetical protein
MKIFLLIILLLAGPLQAFSTVHIVRGTWEDDNSTWSFSKDTITQVNKRTHAIVKAKYSIEHKDNQTRLFLIVTKYRPDLNCTLTLGVPFALLCYEGNLFKGKKLLMKTVKTEGVDIQDYPLFPWPDFEKPYKILARPTKASAYQTK